MGRVVFPVNQTAQKGHSNEFTAFNLTEISCARVAVHLLEYFVYTWQRVQHGHLLLCSLELVKSQYETVLNPIEFILVKEALLLYSGHIEYVEFRHYLLHSLNFTEFKSLVELLVVPDVVRQTQVVRCNEYHLVAVISGESLDE